MKQYRPALAPHEPPQPPGRTRHLAPQGGCSVPGAAAASAAGAGAERRIRPPGGRRGVPGAEDQPPEAREAPQGRPPARAADAASAPAREAR